MIGSLATAISIAALVRKDSLLSVIGGGFFIIFAVQCRLLSTATWDIYYTLYFFSTFSGAMVAWGGLGENERERRKTRKAKRQEINANIVVGFDGKEVRDPEERNYILKNRKDKEHHEERMKKRNDLIDKGW